jgi:hypothetical protein
MNSSKSWKYSNLGIIVDVSDNKREKTPRIVSSTTLFLWGKSLYGMG